MKRREIRTLLDACQSDLRDLTNEEARALVATLEQDSALREQWQAIQSWDAEIRRVLHDVPIPDGLADRLSAAVAAHGTGHREELLGDDLSNSRTTDCRSVQENRDGLAIRPATARRRWLTRSTKWAAGLLATSAVLLLAAWFARWGLGWGDQLTAQQIAGASLAWTENLDPEAWQATNPPESDYPRDPSVRLHVVGWQRCTALTDSRAVAYRGELPPARSTALLYVIKTRQGRMLPTLPPTVPDSTTGDVCVGVWKNNGCLYVLVVPGGPGDYRRTLHQSFAWITRCGPANS